MYTLLAAFGTCLEQPFVPHTVTGGPAAWLMARTCPLLVSIAIVHKPMCRTVPVRPRESV
jgi:hypothetical protein